MSRVFCNTGAYHALVLGVGFNQMQDNLWCGRCVGHSSPPCECHQPELGAGNERQSACGVQGIKEWKANHHRGGCILTLACTCMSLADMVLRICCGSPAWLRTRRLRSRIRKKAHGRLKLEGMTLSKGDVALAVTCHLLMIM